jgi:hypothetical protein
MHIKSMVAAAALTLFASSAANAATEHFMATLKGVDETPPTTSAGTGMVMASYDTDTKMFTYDVTYSGLTGPAKAAHFHEGPVGKAGKPVLMVTVAPEIKGSATLTDAQAAGLESGNWYFNIHTAANPGGEVRGQLLKN